MKPYFSSNTLTHNRRIACHLPGRHAQRCAEDTCHGELEPVKRGVYAGAGIVADPVPENEWTETMNKGRAIFRAVAVAGLDGADQ